MTSRQKKSRILGSPPNIPTRLKKQLQRELRAEADSMRETGSAAPGHSAPGNSENTVTLQSVNPYMARDAAIVLGMGAAIAVVMLLVAVLMPEGREAIKGIGGFVKGPVSLSAAQVALTLDILFPLFYGAGLVVFATSLQTRGNRPLVRLILTAMLVGVAADFAENAFAFDAMTGGNTYPFQWPLTVVKYAAIAFAAVLLSSLIIPYDGVSALVRFAARYLFPLGVAALISGIGGEDVRSILAVLFPISLLLLAQLAHNLGNSDQG